MTRQNGAAVERVLAALRDHGSRVEQRGTDTWMAQCPADGHDDRKASLSVAQGDAGAVVCCQAGCDTRTAVLPPLGLGCPGPVRPAAARRATRPRAGSSPSTATPTSAASCCLSRCATSRRTSRIKRPTAAAAGSGASARRAASCTGCPRCSPPSRQGRRCYLVRAKRTPIGSPRLGQRRHVQLRRRGQGRGSDEVAAGVRRRAARCRRGRSSPTGTQPGVAHARAAAADLDGKAKSVAIVQAAVDREHADVSDHLDAGLQPRRARAAEGRAESRRGGDGRRRRAEARRRRRGLVELALERFDLVMSEDGRPYGVPGTGRTSRCCCAVPGALRDPPGRDLRRRRRAARPRRSRHSPTRSPSLRGTPHGRTRAGYLRLARHDDRIVIDLGTADGRCVIVGPGGWRPRAGSPVLFRRTALTSVIPDPVRDGDGLAALAAC